MRLRTEKKSYWIDVEIGAGKCSLEVMPLSSADIRDIIKRHTKVKYVRGQKQEETDDLAIRLERFCKTVQDWKGLTDEADEPLKATDENKRLIAEFNHDFVLQVFESTDDINVLINASKAEDKKNSKN